MPEPTLPSAAETQRFIENTEAARDKRIKDTRAAYRDKANEKIDVLRKEVNAVLSPHRAYLKAAEAKEAQETAKAKGADDA